MLLLSFLETTKSSEFLESVLLSSFGVSRKRDAVELTFFGFGGRASIKGSPMSLSISEVFLLWS
jgi:hypothetical protein